MPEVAVPYGEVEAFRPRSPRDVNVLRGRYLHREAVRLKAIGWDVPEITDELGYPSEEVCLRGMRSAMAETVRFARDEARFLELCGLDEVELRLWKMLEDCPPLVQQGKVVIDRNGREVPDKRFTLEVFDRIKDVKAQRCKLLGLNAPTRSEVITLDGVEAEIARLERELGRNPAPAAHAGGPAVGGPPVVGL
jgi:hypothetical protein